MSAPLPPDAIEPGDPDVTYTDTKNANRVVVTINGGGDVNGRGGGINQISITAGGTTRGTLPPDSVQHAPTFTSTQSRCGGPLTLVVDESNSIGTTDIVYVRNAVTAFIQALAGTPVQIQVVRFQTTASILGDASAWSKYYDMTKDADVTALLAAVPSLQGHWSSGGGTNWEDAIFRTFYAPSDPGGAPNSIIPKTVVFFTDGVPTWDRITKRGAPGVLTTEPALPGPGWFSSSGSQYSQVGFNRADYWADIWRAADDTKLIGVGVGEEINNDSEWMANPRVGYHVGWQERSSFTYQQVGYTYEQLVWLYEQLVTTWEQSGLHLRPAHHDVRAVRVHLRGGEYLGRGNPHEPVAAPDLVGPGRLDKHHKGELRQQRPERHVRVSDQPEWLDEHEQVDLPRQQHQPDVDRRMAAEQPVWQLGDHDAGAVQRQQHHE